MDFNHQLFYDTKRIDRASLLRRDEAWLTRKKSALDTLVMPVWRNRNFIKPDNKEIFLEASPHLWKASYETVFLGLVKGQSVFAIDLSGFNQQEALAITGEGVFLDLRRIATTLISQNSALMAYARALIDWNKACRYCSRCGASLKSEEAGHIRVCSNPACDAIFYPRLNPAVIVLIEHQPTDGSPPLCLLGRGYRTPPKMYSTLAGFVEPGESLEEAVKREMMEEVGLEVEDIQYVASQPWPFPSSLMAGFFAQSETTDITLQKEEISEAQWFSAQEIVDRVRKGALILSKEDSIARFLIKQWIHKKVGSI